MRYDIWRIHFHAWYTLWILWWFISDLLICTFALSYIRYKESFSKSTRGWKERLFSRNSSISVVGSEVRSEVNAGIANISRMMERFETRENDRAGRGSAADNLTSGSNTEVRNQNTAGTPREILLNDSNTQTSCDASSTSRWAVKLLWQEHLSSASQILKVSCESWCCLVLFWFYNTRPLRGKC